MCLRKTCSRLASIALVSLAACGGEPLETDDGELGVAEDAVETGNALTPNALTPNALTPNALTPNALTPNALTPNALTPNAMTAIQNSAQAGTLSRQLLKYTVSCALLPTQSFSFSWTDANGVTHPETYWGDLGLASSWASGPLDAAGQGWVSACLAMRTNWYGTSVTISARAAHAQLNKVGTPEMTSYDVEEGAFFGNLFTASPFLYACNNPANVAYSRAHQRDCAAGHLNSDGTTSECGIIDVVGSCDDVCSRLKTTGKYRPACFLDNGYQAQYVISVFLD